MTVHKSQGSEFECVAVVLPDASPRVLGRELLYTAVTRARSHVTLHAGEAVLRATIARPLERWSGLPDLLRDA
jgi:exodeoxyribonuclease V alpha subunit